MEGESMLMAVVSAEVLIHDGTNWIHLDYTDGTQNASGLSTIQLIKTKQEFRIIAQRRMDNKRIVDQGIFNRLKYKEATPSFHQWRNEQKQVIGLSFQNEHEAKIFYLAVKQALDTVMNCQQFTSAQKSRVDTATYQSPQNFPNYVHQQHDIYSNHDSSEGPKNNGGYIDNYNQINNCICLPGAPTNQQQNLIRRASQGSNISSSTGGSLPCPIYGQGLVILQNNYNSHENTNPICANSGVQQSERNNANLNNDSPTTIAKAQTGNAPPPPPPPPPDLKNLLSNTKQLSFADQLRHVQLRKSSANAKCDNTAFKSTNSATTNSGENQLNSIASTAKVQNGNQDLISELADRLNKRKINAESGNTNFTQQKYQHQHALEISKKNTSADTSQKKIPSVSSLSSQDDTNSNNLLTQANNNLDQQNGSNRRFMTVELERLRSELKEAFAEEFAKFKTEITQTICNEIAKITNQK